MSLVASSSPFPLSVSSLSRKIPSVSSIRTSAARSSLVAFIKQFWHLVEPSKSLSWNWHLDEFCKLLESIYHGTSPSKRHIINVPPGMSKSIIVSVMFNAWVWANDPRLQFLTGSYTIDLTIRDNGRVRDIVQSDEYRSMFGVELASEKIEKVETTAKGWRIATSVDGFATGEHPNGFIIIDDPLKATHATSEAKLKSANNWIDSTISTRVRNDPTIILVMQRLHEDDPSGHLMAKGRWSQMCFPMRYESQRVNENDPRNIPDPRDQRTVDGELLWSEVWPEDKVQDEERDLDIGASGQLQQLPVPAGGLLYNRDWFQFVDEILEPIADECRGWDTAETDKNDPNAKKNAWSTGTKVAFGRSGKVYVSDHVYVQEEIIDDLMLSIARQDGKRCKIREGSGSGKSMIKSHLRLLAGYDYDTSPETQQTGDKTERNKPFRVQAKGRNVYIVRGSWNDRWLSVICNFPLGRIKDDVDSTSNAFNGLVGSPAKKKGQACVGR